MKLFDTSDHHIMAVDAHTAHQLAEKLQQHMRAEHGDADMGAMMIALLLCAEACAGTISKSPWLTLRGALDVLEAATEPDEAELPEAKA